MMAFKNLERFLFRVETLQKKHNISGEELYANFHLLLEGQAQEWYWLYMEENSELGSNNFSKFRVAFLDQFRHADCDEEIRTSMNDRKQGELRTDPSKTQAMLDFPIPSIAKQLRRFLGLCGWYRRFLPNFAYMTAPMTDCLKKGREFKMSSDAINSFEKLIEELTSPKILTNADFKKHFYLQCDASTGIGSVLFQLDEQGNERPIGYMSQKLNSAQKNYTVTELERLAAVVSVQKFRAYIDGLPFTIITDHMSFKWLMSQKELWRSGASNYRHLTLV